MCGLVIQWLRTGTLLVCEAATLPALSTAWVGLDPGEIIRRCNSCRVLPATWPTPDSGPSIYGIDSHLDVLNIPSVQHLQVQLEQWEAQRKWQ